MVPNQLQDTSDKVSERPSNPNCRGRSLLYWIRQSYPLLPIAMVSAVAGLCFGSCKAFRDAHLKQQPAVQDTNSLRMHTNSLPQGFRQGNTGER